MSKIKVNELTQQTPTLNDTIVASGEDKEYACKVDDLKTLIGRKEIYQDFTDHVTFAAGEREATGTSRIKELVSYCFEEGKIPIVSKTFVVQGGFLEIILHESVETD